MVANSVQAVLATSSIVQLWDFFSFCKLGHVPIYSLCENKLYLKIYLYYHYEEQNNRCPYQELLEEEMLE